MTKVKMNRNTQLIITPTRKKIISNSGFEIYEVLITQILKPAGSHQIRRSEASSSLKSLATFINIYFSTV